MSRNHLIGSANDAVKAVLAVVGNNFRHPLAWLAALLCARLTLSLHPPASPTNHAHAG